MGHFFNAYSIFSDWRGLAESARIDVAAMAGSSRISCTSHTIHRWAAAGGTVRHLLQALTAMDRHDVIHDVKLPIGECFVAVHFLLLIVHAQWDH